MLLKFDEIFEDYVTPWLWSWDTKFVKCAWSYYSVK